MTVLTCVMLRYRFLTDGVDVIKAAAILNLHSYFHNVTAVVGHPVPAPRARNL